MNHKKRKARKPLVTTSKYHSNTRRPVVLRKTGKAAPLGKETGNFSASLTLDQLAEAQGVGPIYDADRLKGGWPADDEVDDFIEAVYQSRD